jgi:hypothetical protein
MDPKLIERELDEIDMALTLLKRDYEIYFSGGSKLPPYEAHRKVESRIRKYSGLSTLNYAQRFRFNNITARFHSYVDLWAKQMRNKEEGRTPSGGVIQVAEKSRKERRKGSAVADAEANHFQTLFNDYLKSKEKTGEKSTALSFEKFSEQLSRQRQTILERYQCSDVEFYVAVEQGKTKLKAKPVKVESKGGS